MRLNGNLSSFGGAVWIGAAALTLAGVAIQSRAPASAAPEAPAPGPTTQPAARKNLPNIAYTIAPWFLFYDGALSLTFDGNDPKVLADVFPLLSDRERPIGATFFVTPEKVGKGAGVSWDDLRKVAGAGYELAARPKPGGRGTDAGAALRTARDAIEREIPGALCLTVAYPGGEFTPEAVEHYRAGLLTGRNYQYRDYPKNVLRLEDHRIDEGSVPALKQVIEQTLNEHGWAIVSYGRRGDDFSEQMEMILDYHPRLWDASVRDVVRYIREAQTARLDLAAQTEISLTLRPTDRSGNDQVFNHALSIEVALPPGWAAFTAEQGGKPVWHGVVRGKARFNAVPNGGDVVLRRKDRP